MSPSRSRRITLVVLSALALAILVAASATAATRGHLDPSFGKGGRLEVKSELQKGRELGQVAPTVGGPIYFTEDTYVCREGGRAPCRDKERLRRFEPDGRVDRSYAPGSDVFPGLVQEVELIADSNGLPVFGWERDHRVYLRRLLPSGRLDPRFGDGGTVTLRCRCALEGFEATADGGLLVSASVRRQLQKGREPESVAFLFEKLRADGSLDPRFAHHGVARVRAKTWNYAEATPGRGGSVFLTGGIKRHGSGPNYFAARLNQRGELDRGFGRAAVAAARGAYARDSYLWEELFAFPRRGGVELFASTTYGRTVVLGLRADGSLDPGFGKGGETQLRLDIADAADAGGGRLFVVGNHGSRWSVQMIDPDGNLDRGFGSLSLPGAYDEYGLWIYPDGPGRAIVVSPGESVCRQECPSEPRIYRVLD
jgi:uncharacterized delta-60 repeat protein